MIIDINTCFGTSKYEDIDLSFNKLKKELKRYNINKAITYSLNGHSEEALKLTKENKDILSAAVINVEKAINLDKISRENYKLIKINYKDVSLLKNICKSISEKNIPVLISAEKPGTPIEIAKAFSDLNIKVILTDVNYSQILETISVLKSNKNFLIDTNRLALPRIIELIDSEVGIDRVVFGSETPFRPIGDSLNAILCSEITDEKKEKILYKTACKLFSLKLEKDIKIDFDKLKNKVGYTDSIIDIHTHPDFMMSSDEGKKLIKRLMKQNNVEFSILSSLRAITKDMVKGNAELSDLIKNEQNMFGYVVVDPNKIEDSCREMDKYYRNPKFVGAKLHCEYSKQNTGSRKFMELIKEVEKRGKPILIHNDGLDWMHELRRVALSHPNLKIIIAHGAWHGIEKVLAGLENVYFEFSNSHPEKGVIENLRRRISYNQFLFGSDLVINDTSFILGLYKDAGFTKKQLKAIMYKNAKNLFDLKI